MTITLAFDVYGTLINTSGVNDLLKQYIDDKAELFMDLWRSKQLEYSFRRGLMKRYEKFSICTRNALDYSDAYLNTGLTEDQKKSLMHKYRVLPAFHDVTESLVKLQSEDYRMFAFSNGFGDDVKNLLINAEVTDSIHETPEQIEIVDVVGLNEIGPRLDLLCQSVRTPLVGWDARVLGSAEKYPRDGGQLAPGEKGTLVAHGLQCTQQRHGV